jgi:ABC-type antimicrobial peptide transport system permease subunit
VRSTDLDQVQGPVVYYSYWQFSPETINFYVRSASDLDVLARNITSIVYDIDPSQALDSIKPLNDIRSEWLAPTRLRATLIALFGMLALVVTLSGVVGVVSYNISQRIREIGVHMAIGATPANVMNLFITDGLKIYLAGLLLGLVLMLAGASMLEPLLYETAAINPQIYLLSALALTLTVLIAICLTARKAGLMNPMTALHNN